MKYMYSPAPLEIMRSCPYLTDRERKAMNLYYFRGWEIERIAAEMDVSRATVCNYLKHLREKAFFIAS